MAIARKGTYIPAQLSPDRQKRLFLQLGNMAKNWIKALRLSSATVWSVLYSGPKLKPTLPGDSMYRRLASLFQEQLDASILVELVTNRNGPFSQENPIRLEQPGPPFSHRITGSLSESWRDSKKMQWNAFSAEMFRYPENHSPVQLTPKPVTLSCSYFWVATRTAIAIKMTRVYLMINNGYSMTS